MATGAWLKCKDFHGKSIHFCTRREAESKGIRTPKLYELFAGGTTWAPARGSNVKISIGKAYNAVPGGKQNV